MRPLVGLFTRSVDVLAGNPAIRRAGSAATCERRTVRARLVSLLTLTLGAVGCQCCSWTEHYQDTIDHIADHQPHLDRFYHPGLDLTRIGYPDWCQSGVNRCLYGDCCCRDTRQQPPYIHNPMYSPQPRETQLAPIPEGPEISPRDDTGPDLRGSAPVPTGLQGIPDSKKLQKGDLLPPLPPPRPTPMNTPPIFPAEPATP